MFRAAPTQPKLFFKGGTSLSKGYKLIERFSEDIDLVLSRPGLGIPKAADPTHAKLSSDARKEAIAAIMTACKHYVADAMMKQLQVLLPTYAIALDVEDEDGATLLVKYESLFKPYEYMKQQVKVECGARGAAEPCQPRPITPYIQSQLPKDKWSLTTKGVTLIRPERTCWEKISILHMAHCRFANDGKPPGDRQYASRHYYDVAMLHEAGVVGMAMLMPTLLSDVKKNLQLMWRTNQTYLGSANFGTLIIVPPAAARPALEADYAGMEGMMFANAPPFSWVIEKLAEVEAMLNSTATEMMASA